MAPKSYAQIRKQIEALQRQADELRVQEVAGVVARIKEAIAHYGLTADQLGYNAHPQRTKSKAQKVEGTGAAKYSDGLGNSWRGRGPRPRWLKAAMAAGKTLEELASSGGAVSVRAGKPSKKAKKTLARKRRATAYRDEAGNFWSGFGPRPQWLRAALEAGKTLEQLAVTDT